MNIQLRERTEESVKIYFEQSQQPFIKKMLPQKARNLEEAIEDYKKSNQPGSTSFGKIIYVGEKYVGDVWCYCINLEDTPNAMLSFCIFDKEYANMGIASEAVDMFLQEISEKYNILSVGAFVFADNTASHRVLEKNGFILIEEFKEDDRKSRYYQRLF